jgi:hypothetical protein
VSGASWSSCRRGRSTRRGLGGSRWIDLHCSVARFLELERAVLRVHRDGAPDWATDAQTNLLSLITLCARLGVERLN